MTTPAECVILDIPDGLRLDLLGVVVEVGRVRIVADRAGLLGGLLASLTCGGAAAADRLEAMARLMRAEEGSGSGGGGAAEERSGLPGRERAERSPPPVVDWSVPARLRTLLWWPLVAFVLAILRIVARPGDS